MVALLGILSIPAFLVSVIGFIVQLIRKKKNKVGWGIATVVSVVLFLICIAITPMPEDSEQQTETVAEDSKQPTSESPTQPSTSKKSETPTNTTEEATQAEGIVGKKSDKVVTAIESDGFVEKLVSFGLAESEANEAADLLRTCGIPSLDSCERTDPNATVDGLMAIRGKMDDDRIFMFTIDNRKIFYVAFNGEDLYDEDKGGYLKNFNDVHVPETEVDSDTWYKLRDMSEAELDKYFGASVRYYDAWGVAREDNSYMTQCEISDGSIFTSGWAYGKVWYELQTDGTFTTTAVEIDGQQYEVK